MQKMAIQQRKKFSLDFGLIVIINHWSQKREIRYKVISYTSIYIYIYIKHVKDKVCHFTTTNMATAPSFEVISEKKIKAQRNCI
jgi:hypothetical protein